MRAADLVVENASWASRGAEGFSLHATSFSVAAGRLLGIVGPNGAGKSTLLRLLYRYNMPATGRIMVGGDDIWAMPPRKAARKVAAVLQEQPTDFALTVGEVVALGRVPHRDGFSAGGAAETAIIEAALLKLDLAHLAFRQMGTLSGGERQRVMVARALAQQPQVLILDEPTNHLDIRHQLEVLDLIRNLDLTVVTSLHDLNLAAGLCDDLLILKQGKALAFGTPAEVLTEDLVTSAFHVDARADWLNRSDTRHFTFHLQTKRTPLQ
ncbi:ABC transporter ATP-binding protein [Gymnodinialimonas hymeniacidonis]|uniref:ABC transporter ATP-binding protein n=1 Tax=Gymnodinialimonas hymeniacidonis TaxID=3126508 RepID=UPI0034C5F8CC